MDDRDAQLRRRILNKARLNGELYQHGAVPFGLLATSLDDAGRAPDDEAHAARLIGDLCEWGLLEEARSAVGGGVAPTNRSRRFKFTTKAFALWSREIPPIPGVADDRLL